MLLAASVSAAPYTKNAPVSKRATGGTVTNPAIAVFTINDNDGIGAGADT